MSKKAIIFDLDGTLMHTLPDIDRALGMMLSALSYPAKTYADTLAGINNGTRHLVRHVLPDVSEEKLDEAVGCYLDFYAEHYADTTLPFSGITELVDKLYADGYKLAVLSNKPDPFTKDLVKKGFGDKLSPVIGQGKYKTKPSPEAPLAIASELCVAPCDIILVGDSDVDMRTAIASGMYPLGVAWGYREPSLLLSAGAADIARTTEELYSKIRCL